MMNLSDKLKSRKFWISLALIVIGIVMVCTGDADNGIKVIVIGGGGYLTAEGVADVISRIWTTYIPETAEDEEDPPEDDCPASDEGVG